MAAKRKVLAPGKCRVCGCDELHACLIPDGNGLRTCSWANVTEDLCSRCYEIGRKYIKLFANGTPDARRAVR